MPAENPGLKSLLSHLTVKRAGMMPANADRGKTSHPIGNAEDSTTQSNLTGARSAENTTDSKKQNPVNPDTAPATSPAPTAGSQGVDAKAAEQPAADRPSNTSGVSDMANKDTSLVKAGADAAARLKVALAAAKTASAPAATAAPAATPAAAPTKTAEDKAAADKLAAEKFGEYCEELTKNYHPDFVEGMKVAGEVIQIVLKSAAAGAADGGAADPNATPDAGAMDPNAMGGAGGAPGADGGQMGGGDELAQLAQQLQAAGVTPEMLAQALQAEESGTADQGDAGQMQALQEAMQAEGTTPDQLAQDVQTTGGATGAPPGAGAPPPPTAGDAAAKAAADRAHNALVDEFRASIRATKTAAAAIRAGKK